MGDNMTATNPKDFEKVIKLLPRDVLENVWFFPIRQDTKRPEVPGGSNMKSEKNRLKRGDALGRLQKGKNVGIYALEKGLMFLDLDVADGKIIASPVLLEKLSKTMTIQTRNGGRQYYYLNDGKYTNQLIQEGKKVVGELRADWWYVVSVGSYVPSDEKNAGGDGTYRLISENQPIAEFHDIGLNLKPRSDTKTEKSEKNITQYDHEKPENQISNGKHLRELAKMGIINRVRRVKI